MALSERLYELRRKEGLSQEQLAERLDVSRQAISKWESGKATPESDTLLAISRYFHVSLDYLMKDDCTDSEPAAAPAAEPDPAKPNGKPEKSTYGIVICVVGIVALIVWGIVSIFLPSASDRIGTSSAITLDGNGLFLILCLAAIIAGAVLFLKHPSDPS